MCPVFTKAFKEGSAYLLDKHHSPVAFISWTGPLLDAKKT